MSKKNGNTSNIIYKDGKAYLNGKLIGIGFKEGEHIPRASDYKLPKRLTKLDKLKIELGREINKSLHEAYLNEQKSKG